MKIKNPLTGKLIESNGSTAKKLLEMHKDKTIKLPSKVYKILKGGVPKETSLDDIPEELLKGEIGTRVLKVDLDPTILAKDFARNTIHKIVGPQFSGVKGSKTNTSLAQTYQNQLNNLKTRMTYNNKVIFLKEYFRIKQEENLLPITPEDIQNLNYIINNQYSIDGVPVTLSGLYARLNYNDNVQVHNGKLYVNHKPFIEETLYQTILEDAKIYLMYAFSIHKQHYKIVEGFNEAEGFFKTLAYYVNQHHNVNTDQIIEVPIQELQKYHFLVPFSITKNLYQRSGHHPNHPLQQQPEHDLESTEVLEGEPTWYLDMKTVKNLLHNIWLPRNYVNDTILYYMYNSLVNTALDNDMLEFLNKLYQPQQSYFDLIDQMPPKLLKFIFQNLPQP